MARGGKSGGYGSYGRGGGRSGSYGSGRASGGSRSFSSAQAHQHVGQSKFGYTKTYSPGVGFRMSKD